MSGKLGRFLKQEMDECDGGLGKGEPAGKFHGDLFPKEKLENRSDMYSS